MHLICLAAPLVSRLHQVKPPEYEPSGSGAHTPIPGEQSSQTASLPPSAWRRGFSSFYPLLTIITTKKQANHIHERIYHRHYLSTWVCRNWGAKFSFYSSRTCFYLICFHGDLLLCNKDLNLSSLLSGRRSHQTEPTDLSVFTFKEFRGDCK